MKNMKSTTVCAVLNKNKIEIGADGQATMGNTIGKSKFKKGDLVISNSGNTLYELAIMHIPSMCITSFKHEIPYANAFSKFPNI